MLSNMPCRRELLRSGCGFGSLAMAGLLTQPTCLEAATRAAADRPVPHFAPRAKRVIMLYMEGGPSQLDLLEYKPALRKLSGKTVELREDKFCFHGALMPTRWNFRQSRATGWPISELLPHLSDVADDLCLLHGVHTDSSSHTQATVMLHTGAFRVIRPSVGSWVVYGLGTENENLPGFVTINPIDHLGGTQNYSSAFLPASHQGTRLGVAGDTLPDLANASLPQRRFLDLVQAENQEFLQRRGAGPEIEVAIENLELAFRMQTALPQAMDVSQETAATQRMYGITNTDKSQFSVQCLMARRLAEVGVRFIQLTQRGWDNHTDLSQALPDRCRQVDQPIAALIFDLKQRGLLEDTLIVWGGEFGRSSAEQNSGEGRRHQNLGYTMFLAGGGVKGGLKYGATDETGSRAVEGRIHIHDLHATILHLLGIDHERLTYRFSGREFRLTDVYGRVIQEILS